MRALLAVGILISIGCRPTRDECERSWDRIVTLSVEGQDEKAADMGKSFLEARKTEFVKECLENGRKSEVQCILRAKTKDDLDKCGK